MEKNFIPSSSIRATLKEMAIGDLLHFPTSRLSVVRSTATTLGVELDRKYSSRLNRENMTIDVTRLS